MKVTVELSFLLGLHASNQLGALWMQAALDFGGGVQRQGSVAAALLKQGSMAAGPGRQGSTAAGLLRHGSAAAALTRQGSLPSRQLPLPKQDVRAGSTSTHNPNVEAASNSGPPPRQQSKVGRAGLWLHASKHAEQALQLQAACQLPFLAQARPAVQSMRLCNIPAAPQPTPPLPPGQTLELLGSSSASSALQRGDVALAVKMNRVEKHIRKKALQARGGAFVGRVLRGWRGHAVGCWWWWWCVWGWGGLGVGGGRECSGEQPSASKRCTRRVVKQQLAVATPGILRASTLPSCCLTWHE